MNYRHNILVNTDSYKASHFLQYPKNTTKISSYIESRGGKWNRTVFFGLQMFLKDYLCHPFNEEDLEFAEWFWKNHGLPFNSIGAKYILDEYGGYLPVRIRAIREGSVIETGNVLVQIENTDDKCSWLVSFLETPLLRSVWYPVTVATNSFMSKQLILDFLKLTSDDPWSEINFKLHDFGARGVSSYESAMIGGCAHLTSFMGSDTTPGVLAAKEYYGIDMAGFSIPASEHSTITSWGRLHELGAYENIINMFAGEGKLYACVSDSYDIWNSVEVLWPFLKERIISKGGTLVVRPDSGNPVAVTAGVIERLMSKFGCSINTKGYKVLPDYIRVLQGDGIEFESIQDILRELQFRKISASNIAFGEGGALLQHMNRDTFKFAMKCSYIEANGEKRDVYKQPITDPGKTSKRGKLALIRVSPSQGDPYYQTIRENELNGKYNELEVVYENGKLLRDQSFEEIRNSINKELR